MHWPRSIYWECHFNRTLASAVTFILQLITVRVRSAAALVHILPADHELWFILPKGRRGCAMTVSHVNAWRYGWRVVDAVAWDGGRSIASS